MTSITWVFPAEVPGATSGSVVPGKKTAVHPLQDVDSGRAPSADETRRRIIAASELPKQQRNATALDREAVRAAVLQTYTTTAAAITSIVTTDEQSMTEQERSAMRAQRVGAAAAGGASAAAVVGQQAELVRHVEAINAELRDCWARGEKVKSLRLAIQATKLLSVTRVPQCYPSIFVLVATVLDTFGDLVAQRLQATAAGKSFVVAALLQRGQDAAADLIPPEAVETCSNWFLKIASIRELLPRICIELSLLKCNKFLAKKARATPTDVVQRLARQIRGVADPLVAAHLRWYLFMRAAEVLRHDEWAAALEQCCLDTFATLQQLTPPFFEKMWLERDVNKEHYLSLFVPALQWQLDTIARHGRKSNAAFVKDAFAAATQVFRSSALVLPLLRAFAPADLLAYTPDLILYHIDEVETSKHVSRLQLVEAFALAMAEFGESSGGGAAATPLPLSRAARAALLNEMWGRVEVEGGEASCDMAEFFSTCGALLQYCARHMGAKQVNVLLGVVRKMAATTTSTTTTATGSSSSSSGAAAAATAAAVSKATAAWASKASGSGAAAAAATMQQEAVYRLLAGLVCNFDVAALLASAHFLPLLRQCVASVRHRLATTVLQLLPSDPQHAAVALELCRTLHDLFEDGESDSNREQSAAICSALRAVASPDPERQLEFMCETRHSLPMLDSVKAALVHEAVRFVHRFGKVGGRRRGAAKAFLAFCHVTVPAAKSAFVRVQLALAAASVALQHGLVAQGEALLHVCVTFLRDFTALSTLVDGTVVSNDTRIKDCVLQLIAIGAAAPSHAKHGHMYVLRAVLQWNEQFRWAATSDGKAAVYAALIRALCCAARGALGESAFLRCGTEHAHKDPAFVAVCEELAAEVAGSALQLVRSQVAALGGSSGIDEPAAAAAAAAARKAADEDGATPLLYTAAGSMGLELLQAAGLYGDPHACFTVRELAAEAFYLSKRVGDSAAAASGIGGTVEHLRYSVAVSAALQRQLGLQGFGFITDDIAIRAERKRLQSAAAAAAAAAGARDELDELEAAGHKEEPAVGDDAVAAAATHVDPEVDL